MQNNMNLNVRIGGGLSDFVGRNVSDDGDYDNVSEYIRDLIRQDKTRYEDKLFLRLKAELQQAFSAPDTDYEVLDVQDIITRNAKE